MNNKSSELFDKLMKMLIDLDNEYLAANIEHQRAVAEAHRLIRRAGLSKALDETSFPRPPLKQKKNKNKKDKSDKLHDKADKKDKKAGANGGQKRKGLSDGVVAAAAVKRATASASQAKQ